MNASGEFTVGRKQLQEALDVVAKAAAMKTITALGCVRIVAGRDGVRVGATDLDMWINAGFLAQVKTEGTFLVSPLAKLAAAVKQLDDDELTVSATNGEATVRQNGTTLRFATHPVADYPAPPAAGAEVAAIDAEVFLLLWEHVRRSVSKDLSRPVLTGVWLEVTGGRLTMAATDSYRLAVAQAEVGGEDAGFGCLLAGTSLAQVAKMASRAMPEDPPLAVTDNGKHVAWSDGLDEVVARRIDGQFPKWEQLFPDGTAAKVTVPRESMLAAVGKVAKLSSKDKPLSLYLDPASKQAKVLFREADRVAVEVTVKGVDAAALAEPLELGINPAFFADALASFAGEKVTVDVLSALRPFVMTTPDDPGYRHLLMPIKLPNNRQS